MSKEDDLNDLIYGLHRQFPDWPSTFGPCLTDGCNESARGSVYCKHCITKEIGEIVGYPTARKYLFHAEQLASMRRNMFNLAEQKDKEGQ